MNHDNKIFLNKKLGLLISGIEFFKLEKIPYGQSGNFWDGCERYGFEGIHEENWFPKSESTAEPQICSECKKQVNTLYFSQPREQRLCFDCFVLKEKKKRAPFIFFSF